METTLKEAITRVCEGEGDKATTLSLLSIILGSATKAQSILDAAGTVPDLSRMTPSEMSKLVGKSLAARLGASLELGRRAMKPRDVKPHLRYAHEVSAYYQPMLGHLQNEVFHVACLDVRNRLLRDARVASGGFASCAILPRECFAPAMTSGACGVIFVHNHPSGETEPSADDLQLTSRLVKCGKVLGCRVLDHVIVRSQGFTSLAERGLLR